MQETLDTLEPCGTSQQIELEIGTDEIKIHLLLPIRVTLTPHIRQFYHMLGYYAILLRLRSIWAIFHTICRFTLNY